MIDFKDLMNKAQSMQGRLKADLEKLRVEADAGGGRVKVVLNGNREVTQIHIEEEAMDNREMLEDLILAALSSGYTRLNAELPQHLQNAMGGVDLSAFGELFRS